MENDLTKTEFQELLDICPAWEDGRHAYLAFSVNVFGMVMPTTESKTCACGKVVKRTPRAT